MNNLIILRAKANAHYQCQECEATEYIQAHHQRPGDDSSLIILCGTCHSKEHPDIPKNLFFAKTHQPYWNNVSASSLARNWGICSRTIIRVSRKLGLKQGILSRANRNLLKRSIRKLREYQLKFKFGNSFLKSTIWKERKQTQQPKGHVGQYVSFIPATLERATHYLVTTSNDVRTLSALVDKAVKEYLDRQESLTPNIKEG